MHVLLYNGPLPTVRLTSHSRADPWTDSCIFGRDPVQVVNSHSNDLLQPKKGTACAWLWHWYSSTRDDRDRASCLRNLRGAVHDDRLPVVARRTTLAPQAREPLAMFREDASDCARSISRLLRPTG